MRGNDVIPLEISQLERVDSRVRGNDSRRRTASISPDRSSNPLCVEDAELVRRSQGGDLEAFNAIVARYQSQVVNVAARVLGSRASGEDAAQEAFISAFRGIDRFRGGSLRAWLMRITVNAGRDMLRVRRRRPEDSLDESLTNPAFQPVAEGETPEEYTTRTELNTELQRAILSLPDDQRTVLVLIDVQGFAYDEAAEAVGTSIGTVKSRLSRARGKVRDSLMQRRELLPDRFRQSE